MRCLGVPALGHKRDDIPFKTLLPAQSEIYIKAVLVELQLTKD